MTTATAAQLLVTVCPDHGTKETTDYASMRAYVGYARDDDFGWLFNADQTITRLSAYADLDAADGTEPWRCCWHMVIDPHGVFDH